MMPVITYAPADPQPHARSAALCSACENHPPFVLGPVLHGLHHGECQGETHGAEWRWYAGPVECDCESLPHKADCSAKLRLQSVAAEAEVHVECACGEAAGERCEWIGPRADTIVVEWMPESLRGSHEAAANSGVWPHNGALRLRCERSCARRLLESDPWTDVVGS